METLEATSASDLLDATATIQVDPPKAEPSSGAIALRNIPRSPLRLAQRLTRLSAVMAAGAVRALTEEQDADPFVQLRRQARLNRDMAGKLLQIFNPRIRVHGEIRSEGLLVSNHLSYVDILALGSLQPTVFLSKADVARWPLFGWFAKRTGTLFLKREQRGDVAEAGAQFKTVINAGLPLVAFLEGTSTDGRGILPFRSSLLEPAVQQGWPVTPVWIGYQLENGSVENEVCYWRDMTLLPHLLNLMTKRVLWIDVAFGDPVKSRGTDRKELAARLHREVCGLKSACQQARR